jgi:hypothetical protein
VLAAGAVAATLAGQRAAAALTAAVLAAILAVDAAVLLSLRLRRRIWLVHEQDVAASPERVFALLTDLRGPRPWVDPDRRIDLVGAGALVRWRARLDVPLFLGLQPGYRRSLDRAAPERAERLRRFKTFAEEGTPAGDTMRP